MRERCLGKSASWRAGVGRVRKAAISAFCASDPFEEQHRQRRECERERMGHAMRREGACTEPSQVSHVASPVG